MTARGRVRVFIACSLDGFIAGANGDISWLEEMPPPPQDSPKADAGFASFMSGVGALLMGRKTFAVCENKPDSAWPYGDVPVLVASYCEQFSPERASVERVCGDITELVEMALDKAGGKDVYCDGGTMIRQAMDAGLLDDMIISTIPIILGKGHPLFAGVETRKRLELLSCEQLHNGIVQAHYKVEKKKGRSLS